MRRLGGGGGGESVDSTCTVGGVRNLGTFGLADNQQFAHQMWTPWAYQ